MGFVLVGEKVGKFRGKMGAMKREKYLKRKLNKRKSMKCYGEFGWFWSVENVGAFKI